MSDKILVFYGSYRRDRQGVRLAQNLVSAFAARGAQADFIDAKAIDLPMLDRMYKEHPPGEAPPGHCQTKCTEAGCAPARPRLGGSRRLKLKAEQELGRRAGGPKYLTTR